MAQAAKTGEPVEVPEAATPTETLIANPDGTLTSEISAVPVRALNDTGELVDVDTDLKAAGGVLEPVANPVEVQLENSAADGAEVLVETSPAAEAEQQFSVGLGFDGELGAPTVEGPAATYPHDADTSVRVQALPSGFAAHVVLGAAPDAGAESPVFRFPLTLDGVSARLAQGQLEFVDLSGSVVATSSPLIMWDSQVDQFGDPSKLAFVDATLTDGPGGQVLELRPSATYLQDPETVYPVTIDPDVIIDPTQDKDIYSSGSEPTNRFALRVGSANGSQLWRTFLDFDVSDKVGRGISHADLQLFQYAAGTCSARQMDVRSVTGDWAGVKNWANQPSVSSDTSRFTTSKIFNGNASSCGGSGEVSIDVTGQVTAWAGMVRDQRGLILRTPEGQEGNTNFEKRFCSTTLNTSGSGNCQVPKAPVLVVTYTPEIGDQGWYSQTAHTLNDRAQLKVNHRTGNVYLDASDVQVNSVGMPLSLHRRYNSLSEYPGAFGPQWSLNAGPDVWLEKLDQWRYLYHAPDGAVLGPFVREADQSSATDYTKFKTPAGGIGAELKENTNGTFTMTFRKSQKEYVFTPIGTAGNLYQTRQEDRSGNATTFAYTTGTTRLSSITDTAGRTYAVAYTGDVIDTITDTNGPSTRVWNYDYTSGRLTRYTDPEGHETDYTWATGSGSSLQTIATIVDDPNDSGQAPTTTITTVSDQAVAVKYEGDATATPAVASSEYTFDYDTVPLQACLDAEPGPDPDQSATVSSVTGVVTRYCFRDRGRGDLTDRDLNYKVVSLDGDNNIQSTTYTPDNQPATVYDGTPDGGSTEAYYGDPAQGLGDQLTKMVAPPEGTGAGATTHYRYVHPTPEPPGADFLPTSVVDPNDDCTAYGYDTQGRLTDTWIGRTANSNNRCDNLAGVSGGFHYEVFYNTDGTVAWMKDPNTGTGGARTDYTYWAVGDAGYVAGTKGQPKTVKRPGGDCATTSARKLCTSYSYDGLARTTAMVDGNNQTTRYSYDKLDRTTQVLTAGTSSCSLPSGNCMTYTYDPAGNLTQRQDSLGTTSFDYDRMNRQIGQTTPDSVAVAYGYTRDSLLSSLTQNIPGIGNDQVTYTYDDTNQLLTVVDDTGTYNFTHDSAGRVMQTRFPATPGVTVDRDWSKAGRPQAITVKAGTSDGNDLPDYAYTYYKSGTNDTGQLKTYEVTTNGPTSLEYKSTFDYNARNQLTSDGRVDGNGNPITSHTYTYDDAGNIASHTSAGTTIRWGYDRAGQLCWRGTTADTSPVSSCPDIFPLPTGNTRVQRDAAGNSEGLSSAPITYNNRNQATSVNGQAQTYHDQGNDLRETTGTTNLVNTQTGITARTLSGGTTFYTRTPDGRLLGSHGAGGTFYYVTDHQKTTLAVVNATAQRAGSYRYEPYGKTSILESTTAATANPFRWIGAYQTIESGGQYYHFGARYYDQAGHFTQPDPVPGTLTEPLRTNPYLYAGGNPCSNSDPNGRWWGEDAWDSFTGWEGWDEVGQATTMLVSCWQGANVAVEAAAPAALYSSAVLGPEAGVGVEVVAGLVGCFGGMYLSYKGYDAAMEAW